MKTIITGLLLLLFAVQSFAQKIELNIVKQTITYLNENNPNRSNSGTAYQFYYSVGGSDYELISKDYENLGNYLKKNDQAYVEYQRFVKKSKALLPLFLGSYAGLGGVVGSSLIFKDDYETVNLKILLIGGIGILVGSRITRNFLIKSRIKHLEEAVEIYNSSL